MHRFSKTKRKFGIQAIVLAMLVVFAAGYWYEWIYRDGGLLLPIASTVASIVMTAFSRAKRELVMETLAMLCLLAVLGTVRNFFIGESILLGVIFSIALFSVLVFLLARSSKFDVR